ncbi:MAG: trypsin-like peptidase domain-containing protein, partial [Planctomycetales bacterium]|nr:trypsin-like peptidase domain-containing protein [Planctomycetales bacterium]
FLTSVDATKRQSHKGYLELRAAAFQPDGPESLQAAVSAVVWLLETEVAEFYRDDLTQYVQIGRKFDPDNEQGLLEIVFAAQWEAHVLDALMNQRTAETRKLVEEFDAFRDAHGFQNADRAAKLHLLSAGVLATVGDMAGAAAQIQAGRDQAPTDPELVTQLRRAAQMFSGTLASGTGFVVQKGGYLLTNHHVIEGAGRVVVRMPSSDELLAAELVARDEERDMALLHVSDPRLAASPAVMLSLTDVGRGADVATLGFPLGEAVGRGLKFTKGAVSGLPDGTPNRMYLLDVRVNPGNSGGPLCDKRGAVIGMVTAKSYSDESVDSYGMALPAATLVSFLQEHLPGFDPATESPGEVLSWDLVDRRVSPSVFMVMKVE